MKLRDLTMAGLLRELISEEGDQMWREMKRGSTSKTATKQQKRLLREIFRRYSGTTPSEIVLNGILLIGNPGENPTA